MVKEGFKIIWKANNVIYGRPLRGRGSPSKGQIITQKATDEERRKAKQPLYGKCFLTKQVIWNVRQISNTNRMSCKKMAKVAKWLKELCYGWTTNCLNSNVYYLWLVEIVIENFVVLVFQQIGVRMHTGAQFWGVRLKIDIDQVDL